MKLTGFRRTVTRSLNLVLLAGAGGVAALVTSTGVSAGTAHADTMNWDAVAQCESGGNWGADTGNGQYGGLQFKPGTWSSNGGVGSPASASRAEQIRVAENVMASQGPGAWPTCGSQGGSPALWSTSGPPAASGCSVMPGPLGIVNLRQMCSALLNPLAALGRIR